MRDRIDLLVVDDSWPALRLTQQLLEGLDQGPPSFHVASARTIHEAGEKLASGRYDVVLTDLMLTDSRGIDTFRAVRAAAGAEVAVMILTGLDDVDLAVQSVHEGAADYVVKGTVDSRELATRIRLALARHRRHQEGGRG